MRILDPFYYYRRVRRTEQAIIKDYNKQSNNTHGLFTLYNWWNDRLSLWFVKRYSHLLEEKGRQINLCSLFGKKGVIEHVEGIKVFFSGENVHHSPYDEYSDYLLRDSSINLSLGFDFFEDDRYLRFPLWLLYMFNPTSTREDIVARCKELRYPQVSEKRRFCSLVAYHDVNGLRGQMVRELSTVEQVSCAGKFLHNDTSLKERFGDNKIEYLKEFYFNICPENSNSFGYVTEKVFEAISAGCIPIYWGSFNYPEPHILNRDAIIFWEKGGNNQNVIKRIHNFYASPNEMEEMIRTPRLTNDADDIIWGMMEALDMAVAKLLV